MALEPIEILGRERFRGNIAMSDLAKILKVTPAMIRTLGIRPLQRGSKKNEAKYTLAKIQKLISERNPGVEDFWPADNYLTPTEAAMSIGVQVATLANWRSRDRGPAYIVISKRCIRYRPEDITLWKVIQNYSQQIEGRT